MQGCKDARMQGWPELSCEPYFQNDSVRLYHGECLQILSSMRTKPDSKFDAIVTDPPYCSGAPGKLSTDETAGQKYCQSGNMLGRPDFGGDHRDQKSFEFWSTMWLSMARSHCKQSAYGLIFIDWRQLPTMTNVLQAGGFTWKGLISWDKGRSARAPHRGYFRHQTEYIVWGSNGKLQKHTDRGPFDGAYQIPLRRDDKHHITGKPTALLQRLVQCAPVDGLILDMFAGSGTTGVAAQIEGRRAVLIEESEEYCEIAARRLSSEVNSVND